jgi:hypothetical protein
MKSDIKTQTIMLPTYEGGGRAMMRVTMPVPPFDLPKAKHDETAPRSKIIRVKSWRDEDIPAPYKTQPRSVAEELARRETLT